MKRYLAEGILWAISAVLMICCVILNIVCKNYILVPWVGVNALISIVDSYFGFKNYFRTKSK